MHGYPDEVRSNLGFGEIWSCENAELLHYLSLILPAQGANPGRTVGNIKALLVQKVLYSSIPILPPAALPFLAGRGRAAGRIAGGRHVTFRA
ncbi:MAG TPA: hypothetical protein DCG06_06425 [Deltaproteobacteria bacterium]|nr:hypothetical protein [Deltaproteobacteria bacterium]